MTERTCNPGGDCLQYCRALDSTSGLSYGPQGEQPCAWPEKLDGVQTQAQAEYPQSRLLFALCGTLAERLDTNAEATDPLAEAAQRGYDAIHSIFEGQIEIWQHRAYASHQGRVITDVEARHFATELKAAQQEAAMRTKDLDPRAMTLAQARHDCTTLESHGLLFDEATIRTVDRVVDNIVHGRPTLLVGDKGIAKTKVAEFAASLFSGDENVTIISGHGGMMSDELVGKIDLIEGKGTVFQEGKLVKCMREGRPTVLDEVNLADQPVMMRLQDMLLRRPGQSVVLQENGNEPIVIRPGFCVIATANEASARYHNREQLDPAFRDRFDIIRVDYPDAGTPHIAEYPSVNIRLALAHTVTRSGRTIPHVSPVEAVTLARLAHATQRLYSQPAKDVAGNLRNTTSDLIDTDEPLLTDCITPRKMTAILQRVATGTLTSSTIASEMHQAVATLDQHGSRNQTYARKVLNMLITT